MAITGPVYFIRRRSTKSRMKQTGPATRGRVLQGDFCADTRPLGAARHRIC